LDLIKFIQLLGLPLEIGVLLIKQLKVLICSAVFTTTVLPHANAGPTFQANNNKGKFQGMICPATPIGSCNTCT
jgi:hypothetical protein